MRFRCQHCGAINDAADTDFAVRCSSCEQTTRVPTDWDPALQLPGATGGSPAPRASGSGGVAAIVAAAVVVLVALPLAAVGAGVAYFAMARAPEPTAARPTNTPGEAVEVPSPPSAEADVVQEQHCVLTVRGDVPSEVEVRLQIGEDVRRLPSLPIKVEVTARQALLVKALRGEAIVFARAARCEPGEPVAVEVVVPTQFAEQEQPAPGEPTPPRPAPEQPAPTAETSPTGTEPADAAQPGSLAINSIPTAAVLVDGRPVGKTPLRIQVPAGRHTVTFIHPKFGRKVVTATVQPGRTAVAAVRFEQ